MGLTCVLWVLACWTLAESDPIRRASELASQGRYEEAIPAYRQAIKSNPGLAPLRLNLGLALYKTERRKEALSELDAFLRLEPHNRQARHLRALVLLELDRYEESARTFESLLPTDDASIHLGLATAYLRLKRTAEARQFLAPLLARDDSAEIQLILAEAYLNENRNEEALAALERAEALNPKIPTLHFLRGAAHWKRHEPESAISEWRKEVEIDPRSFEAVFALGAALAVHSPAEAPLYLEKALALKPSHAAALYHFGKLKWQLSKDPAAVVYLERALQAKPGFRQAHYLLATIYRDLGQLEKAERHWSVVRKLGQQAVERDLELLHLP